MVYDMTEEWRTIPSVNGYEASDLGRIRSVSRTIIRSNGRPFSVRGKIISPWAIKGGYLVFDCGRVVQVSHSVAEAFIGPKPRGLEVCHFDGDPNNNRPRNLRYDTHLSNMADIRRHGTMPDRRGALNSQAKLSLNDVNQIRSMSKDGMRQTAIAEVMGVSQAQISNIVRNKKWSAA